MVCRNPADSIAFFRFNCSTSCLFSISEQDTAVQSVHFHDAEKLSYLLCLSPLDHTLLFAVCWARNKISHSALNDASYHQLCSGTAFSMWFITSEPPFCFKWLQYLRAYFGAGGCSAERPFSRHEERQLLFSVLLRSIAHRFFAPETKLAVQRWVTDRSFHRRRSGRHEVYGVVTRSFS